MLLPIRSLLSGRRIGVPLFSVALAGLFISSLAPASPAKSGFICPSADIIKTKCQGPKDCLYPNPKTRNGFIHCTVNADGKTGAPVEMPCPKGLEWNDREKICDWPKNSGGSQKK